MIFKLTNKCKLPEPYKSVLGLMVLYEDGTAHYEIVFRDELQTWFIQDGNIVDKPLAWKDLPTKPDPAAFVGAYTDLKENQNADDSI